tara:strand:+ start:293 stop:1060 length:768 start_codon:yes stop_codon:yes gene_type:complete
MRDELIDELVAGAARIDNADLRSPATHAAARTMLNEITSRSNTEGDSEAGLDRARAGSRHRMRRRLAMSGVTAVAASGLIVAGLIATSGDRDDPSSEATESAVQDIDGQLIADFTVSSADAEALATVDGVGITYLPEGVVEYQPSVPDNMPGSETLHFRDAGELGEADYDIDRGVSITVTRGAAAGHDAYVASHYLGNTAPTTVDGAPAIASSITPDGAHAIVWFPEPELAIFVGTTGMSEQDLRDVVDGIQLPA